MANLVFPFYLRSLFLYRRDDGFAACRLGTFDLISPRPCPHQSSKNRFSERHHEFT